ncbi:CidA/LrgA family protein [Alteromonas gracilis]|uniref:CidA/LrgA family protein n=1 Tax=Alteromonas gracilis TaxID=1479524 RepID=UPI002FE37F17
MQNVKDTMVGAAAVFIAYYLGLLIVSAASLPIPGPLLGLFLLLVALLCFPTLEHHVARAVTLPLKHMSLLFIPAVLGVTMYWGDIKTYALAIVIAIVVTTSFSLGFTAWLSQKLLNSKKSSVLANGKNFGDVDD